MNAITRALRSLMRRRTAERDMQDEFRFHLEREAREIAGSGVPDDEARRRAAVAFGGAEAHKDAARDARRWSWLDDLGRDARYAARQLRRTPGFAAVVIGTLAVGIAATSTIFSIVNGVLLRALPYGDPERLVAITGLGYKGEFVHFRDQLRTITVGAYGVPGAVSLTGAGDPARLTAAAATPEMFAVLGVPAIHGRVFTAADEPLTVILSQRLWQQRFGGAADIIGRRVTIDGSSRAVVGVMPATFTFPAAAVDVWTRMSIREGDPIDLWSLSARMVGRLRSDATVAEAATEVRGHVPRIRGMFPWKMPADYGNEAAVVALHDQIVGDVRTALAVLLAAVAAVLAIVCVNVANLMLARGMSRQRELAIRAAIGAGRSRLFRQMMAESLTLAAVAGGLGLLLAYWVLGAVIARLPADIPRVEEIVLDARVVGLTALTSLLAGLVFGIWPAIRASAGRIEPALREAGRSEGMAPAHRVTAHVLVVAEIALAVVLVASAALLVQSFRNLTSVDPGFRAEQLVTATVAPPAFRYKDNVARRAFVDALVERMARAPGVSAVSASTATPLGAPAYGSVFAIEGRPDPATQSGEWPLAHVSAAIGDRYFETIATPLESGRSFTADDRAMSPKVAVVSRSLAAEYWSGASPVGARIKFPGTTDWITIVGVVGDIKWNGLAEEDNRALYRPLSQSALGPVSIVVRTTGDPAAVAATFRGLVAALDGDTPVSDIRTAEALIGQSVAKPRFTASLLAAFALVALFLGAVGVYGVLAYTVSRRTQEIGVRMALGARTRDVLRLVLGQALAVTLAGVVIGLVAAFAATRAMSTLLFGISPADPVVFAGVAGTLVVVALAASWIPARRASRVDPVVAVRS